MESRSLEEILKFSLPFRLLQHARALGGPTTSLEPVRLDPFTYLPSRLRPLGLLLILLVTSACSERLARDVSAAVLASSGFATITRAEREPGAPVTVGARVLPGGTLHTGSDAMISLMLMPGALVQIGPNSTVRLEKLRLAKNGYATDEAMSRMCLLRLVTGTMDVVVQFEAAPEHFRIETTEGAFLWTDPASARLTATAGRLRVQCTRGLINTLPANAPAGQLAAGQFQEWPSQSPAKWAETDASAQSEVEESLRAERNLLELQRRERLRPFPWRNI